MNTRRYQYAYAVIDPNLNDMCIQVESTTYDHSDNPNYIPIQYNEEYLCKYYDRETGKWYLESTHETEWNPS